MSNDTPFTKENRPHLTQESLDEMNSEFAACMAKIPAEYHRGLREWAKDKVEMGWCLDKHPILKKHTVIKDDSPLKDE